MADIDKIKASNGTEYNLKDSVARDSISPSSFNVKLKGCIGVRWTSTELVFVVPKPMGMNPRSAVSDVSTVTLVDLALANIHSNVPISDVSVADVSYSHFNLLIKIPSDTELPTNHPVRFAGTAPTITVS